jgi:surface antigen
VLLVAVALVYFLATPSVPGGLAPLPLRGLAAIQIDAVIERPAVAPLTVARPAQTVVVHAGDTVESLARAYGSDTNATRWANSLAAKSEPAMGTSLVLPPSGGALVRVGAGETPTTFAQRIGMDPRLVLDYNALSSDGPLAAGTYLQVPLDDAPTGALIASRFVVADNGVPAVLDNRGSDTFPYGQCTWYAASRRDVTWGGNAWEWYIAAAGIRPEGHIPVQGAIAVFDVGWSGHVAYVEHVNPDGSFVVSEMNNWGVGGGGWGRIDRRTVSRSDRSVIGFIY